MAYFSSKMVLKGKRTRCFACYRLLPANSRVLKCTGLITGSLDTVYCCQACHTLQRAGIVDDTFSVGCVYSSLIKLGFRTPEEWLDSLQEKEK